MPPVIELLTPWTWHEYVTNLAVDEVYHQWMVGFGVYFSLMALVCLWYDKMPRLVRWPLWLGVAGQVALAFLYMKEYFFHIGQFLEYALQFGTPAFLIVYYSKQVWTSTLLRAMKWATALTFACHGLYAVNYYPRPGLFTSMTMRILGLSENTAVTFLTMAGWLDFVVAIGVFLPWKWAKWALIYAAIWGTLTSLARVLGNFYWSFPLESLHEWLYQTVYRVPHGLVPLIIYLVLHQQNKGTAI